MTTLSIWYVRTSIVYLLIGLTLGMLLLINKGIPLHPAMWRFLPAHIEFLFFGWTLQFALGIAYWILPRFGSERGNVRLAVASYILLNIGVWMTVAGYWWVGRWNMTEFGRVVEFFAIAIFAIYAWPRVKAPGA